MSDSIFTKQITARNNSDGTSTRVIAADPEKVAEKAAVIMTALVEITESPEEALAILVCLLETIKEKYGIRHVEAMENRPQ